MGKSTSCFKIITCGSDSVEKDDLQVTESKASSDKRGWSFRKRSARHRVLSNTVITETPTFGNKEGPESATINFEAPSNTTVSEKISVVHCNDEKPQLHDDEKTQLSSDEKTQLPTVLNPEDDTAENDEKPQLPTTLNPKASDSEVTAENESEKPQLPLALNPNVSDTEVTAENENGTDAKLEESVVIVIQTVVRGFLARRVLLKHKNLVKLQAAVRGHLVRRHAIGTLRCVQAIVKMQALVRARQARLSLEGSCQKMDGKKQENLANKLSGLSTSTEKLLSNRFARQLLEAASKTKRINVKCDPSKPDSAWKWLERWMSVSSVKSVESKEVVSVTEQQEGEKEESFESRLETRIEPEVICESVDSKFGVQESAVPSESEDNLITYEADKFDFQACHSTTSLLRDNLEQPQLEITSTADVEETSVEINSFQNEYMQSEIDSQMEHKSISGEPEIVAEQPKRSMKRLASEQLETEGKKFVYGSKKASNPSFIAAQSRFEVLSSAENPGRVLSSSYQDSGDESHKDTVSSEAYFGIKTKEISVAESPVHGSRIQIGGSECGTELSVTSTLDSPDRSDIVAIEHEPEAKVSEEEICNPNNSMKNLDIEANDVPNIPESSLSHPVLDQLEKADVLNGESVSSVVTRDSPRIELKPERSASDFPTEREQHSEAGVQAHVLSPEASPRSHMTVAESQGTPASQVSVKAKRNRSDKSGSDQKRESMSVIKKSPSNTRHDSGSRSSAEKLPKEQKNAKRRNSFGSTRPDHNDQEPRESSTNSSLPHFMQATESARAKLNANNSPRSSPDVQDRDIYVKKRHSLPGADGRQGSPRIQRSMSQAQQGVKGNERKWQR